MTILKMGNLNGFWKKILLKRIQKQLDINLIILEDKLLALRFIKMKKIKCASVHIVYDENQKNLESVSSSPMIFASGNIFTVNSDNDSVTMIKNSSTGNKYECEIPVEKTKNYCICQ